jgi:DnaD/phage-associated family protein
LNYWNEIGLLKIEYDEANNICGLGIGKVSAAPEVKAEPKKETITLKPVQKQNSSEHQEELRQLYFVAEQYMGKPLSAAEIKKINYFFDELGFSIDLIEYLIEYCVENGHKSMHYIEKVACNWSDANISTVSEAKENCASYNKNYYAILNAFGIKGRSPAALEVEFMKKWFEEYGFTLEIILEACNRTIANTHKADFKYTDSILKNWNANNVRQLADVSKLDKVYQLEKESKKKEKAKSAVTNRFNNFDNRSYDMSSLEQQLLNIN